MDFFKPFPVIYEKSILKASLTFLTSLISIESFLLKPFRLLCGISIREKPSLSASCTRCSMRLTGRISPERPTSPHRHVSLSIDMSRLEDSTALMTARSIPGSLTLSPPAIFRNTSFCASLKPALFSKTASSMFNLLASNPVVERCGVP